MNFKNEEDLLLKELNELRFFLYNYSDENKAEEIKKKIGIVTGTCLWLYSNENTINSLEEFRRRIDKFKNILNNDSYVKMSSSLYDSAIINSFLKGNLSEKEFSHKTNIPLDEDSLDLTFLSSSSTKNYAQAKAFFDSLSMDKDILLAKDECHFPMNFKFGDDNSKAEELYYSVNTFYGIAERLEEIYDLKCKQNKEDKVRYIK